jgi:hypothetical protein
MHAMPMQEMSAQFRRQWRVASEFGAHVPAHIRTSRDGVPRGQSEELKTMSAGEGRRAED